MKKAQKKPETRVFEARRKSEHKGLFNFPLYEAIIAKEEDVVPVFDLEGYYVKDQYADTYQVLVDEPLWYEEFPYTSIYESPDGTIASPEPLEYAYKYKGRGGYEYINLSDYEEITYQLDDYYNWETLYNHIHPQNRDVLYRTTLNGEAVYVFHRQSFWIGDYGYGYIVPENSVPEEFLENT